VSVAALVTQVQGFVGWELSSSMVLPGYFPKRGVTPPPDSTSVLQSRNVRSIGRKDRWWQYCSFTYIVSSLDACAVQAHGSC
jgi:hypothetical protein